jgi:hypothetical protein
MDLPIATRVVRRKGIEFEGGHYVAAALNSLYGDEVQFRYMPHDPAVIEVMHDGHWLCTAKRTDRISRAEAGAIARQRQRDNHRADVAMAKRVARDQLELERMQAADAQMPPDHPGENGTGKSSKRNGSKRWRGADTALRLYGLTDELNQAVDDALNGGTDVDEDA